MAEGKHAANITSLAGLVFNLSRCLRLNTDFCKQQDLIDISDRCQKVSFNGKYVSPIGWLPVHKQVLHVDIQADVLSKL